ncbi:MAG: alpha-L-fucosidase [Clostridia bacterium]|nr:alpha-L-fucosidase [Clostridia bacterium]
MQERLQQIQQGIAAGPYDDSWASLCGHPAPAWFRDAKFGIFIHWGIYSVPAFGSEWYSRNMYLQGSPEFKHHVETWGPQKDFGYKDFLPLFRAERFDPEAWASLFAEAGAKYVIPVAEHHDGFQMYRSDISHWNAAEKGPGRDVLGEIASACRAKGLSVGASTHRAEHWFFMSHGLEFDSDIRQPMQRGDFYWPAHPERHHFDFDSEPAPDQEYLDDWLIRCCEIVDRYHPRAVYFDWWIAHHAFESHLRRFTAYYYNQAAAWGEEAAIFYKQDSFPYGAAIRDVERGRFADWKPFPWQTDTAMALNSWGYTEGNRYREPASLARDLVDIVSKNGCLLLNVGPKPDGTITDEETHILRTLGAWLRLNGDAIYATRPWHRFGEGPTEVKEGQFTEGDQAPETSADFRFVTRGNRLFVWALKCAEDGQYLVTSLRAFNPEKWEPAPYSGVIRDVKLLSTGERLPFERALDGLRIRCGLKTDMPVCFEVVQ